MAQYWVQDIPKEKVGDRLMELMGNIERRGFPPGSKYESGPPSNYPSKTHAGIYYIDPTAPEVPHDQ